MSYSDSLDALEDALAELERDSYESASMEMSFMEAKLPMEDTEVVSELNRLASRYVTIVGKLPNDDYEHMPSKESSTDTIVRCGQKLRECMESPEEGDFDSLESSLKKATRQFEFTGESSRVDEDSAWGQIVSSYLSDSTGSEG